jgi:hypothetical protein
VSVGIYRDGRPSATLADQSSSKRWRISYQNASTSTEQALSTFTKGLSWITSNNSNKPEFKEAEEVLDLQHPEASISKYTQQRMARPIASTQRNTSLIENHLDTAIGEGPALQRIGDCSNSISTFDSSRKLILISLDIRRLINSKGNYKCCFRSA